LDHYALKLFLHLSETLHFGRTGRACHISPSALSRQIQRMEGEVGCRLFERDNRKVTLTSAGLRFRYYAREALQHWQELLDDLADEARTLRGELTIYCSVTASLTVLPELLGAFKKAYPQVNIRLKTGDASIAIKKVIDGDADIAVAALPQPLPKTLVFRVLTRISLEVIAPKIDWEYSKMLPEKIPWSQIPIILTEQGIARKKIDAWFKKKKIKPNIYAQVSSNEAILSMVNLGCGVGIVPSLAIENSSLGGRITRLNVNPFLSPYDVGICIQKRRMVSRLLRAFWGING
jgi:LysR family positive regulator for ilvC